MLVSPSVDFGFSSVAEEGSFLPKFLKPWMNRVEIRRLALTCLVGYRASAPSIIPPRRGLTGSFFSNAPAPVSAGLSSVAAGATAAASVVTGAAEVVSLDRGGCQSPRARLWMMAHVSLTGFSTLGSTAAAEVDASPSVWAAAMPAPVTSLVSLAFSSSSFFSAVTEGAVGSTGPSGAASLSGSAFSVCCP